MYPVIWALKAMKLSMSDSELEYSLLQKGNEDDNPVFQNNAALESLPVQRRGYCKRAQIVYAITTTFIVEACESGMYRFSQFVMVVQLVQPRVTRRQ